MFFKKPVRLFYDISELGWSMYLAAHIRYLFEKKIKAVVATPKSKEVLYRGIAYEILPMPEQFNEVYQNFASDGNHLYNPVTNEKIKDHWQISQPFRDAYPDYKVITSYTTFEKRRIFKPYIHSEDAEEFCRKTFGDKPVIIVLPRHRKSKFKIRNIDKEYYTEIIDRLCSGLGDCNIVTIGSKGGACDITLDYQNYYNLVKHDDDKTLDILVALCNSKRAIAAIGTQSGPIKISLLCYTPAFIYGHEETRHLVTENWSNTEAEFWKLGESEDKYVVSDFEEMYKQTFNFINKQYIKRKS